MARSKVSKRIAIVGVGAVGGYSGAHMARAGEDVTFIDMWPAHVEEMQKNGLLITTTKAMSRSPSGCGRCT